MFKDLNVPRHEVLQLHEQFPSMAEAMVRLYRAYGDRRRREALMADIWTPCPSLERTTRPTPPTGCAIIFRATAIISRTWMRAARCLAEKVGVGALLRGLGGPASAGEALRPAGADHDFRRDERHPAPLRSAPTPAATGRNTGSSGRAFAVAYQLGLLTHGDALNAHGWRPPSRLTCRAGDCSRCH